jgi:tRNA (guanine37-N1)-methyltransferase
MTGEFINENGVAENRTAGGARAPWHATVLTLYPDMFPGPLAGALAGRALARRIWSLECLDIRDHALGKHGSVDDQPFGGGPGMVMRPDVLAAAIDAAQAGGSATPVIYLTPRGAPLRQSRVREIAAGDGATFICGRFEGVDERVLESRGIEEMSIGDYVLSGGEIAALAVIDACVRVLPDVVGAAESLREESFEQGLLEYPHYTRPRSFEGKDVPEVLLSGDHERIRSWRRTQAEKTTRERRADLWAGTQTECANMRAKP